MWRLIAAVSPSGYRLVLSVLKYEPNREIKYQMVDLLSTTVHKQQYPVMSFKTIQITSSLTAKIEICDLSTIFCIVKKVDNLTTHLERSFSHKTAIKDITVIQRLNE